MKHLCMFIAGQRQDQSTSQKDVNAVALYSAHTDMTSMASGLASGVMNALPVMIAQCRRQPIQIVSD